MNLNHNDGQFAGIFETMRGANRDISGLVFRQQLNLIPYCDFGRACNDDPMFGPVHVALEAERGAGMDDDAFDLEPVRDDEAFKPPPRAV